MANASGLHPGTLGSTPQLFFIKDRPHSILKYDIVSEGNYFTQGFMCGDNEIIYFLWLRALFHGNAWYFTTIFLVTSFVKNLFTVPIKKIVAMFVVCCFLAFISAFYIVTSTSKATMILNIPEWPQSKDLKIP